ncbi:MAG: protein-L-isoaspartate O-methyltransferase [Alphaproteobacteria bacterium]
MDFTFARHNMVESQLRPNKVTDSGVLAAMGTLPRERFLPEMMQSVAYTDEDLCIAPARYLMEPIVAARLIQAAAPSERDLALVVGGGAGYEAAVLASMVETVFVVESDAALFAAANTLFSDLALDNIVIVEGALEEGLGGQGPFNIILINGCVQILPESLKAQLAENGRLVCVMDKGDGIGRATVLQRTGGAISHRTLFDASVPVLDAFRKASSFVF